MKQSIFLAVLALVAVAIVDVGAGTTDEPLATFELYDNGSSSGSVNVTLSRSEFHVGSPEDPGLLFAVEMSKLQNVSKYMAKTPVVATRAYREDGELVTSFDQLKPEVGSDAGEDAAAKLRRVYLVADGLELVWPFVSAGHRQAVSTKILPPATEGGEPVILESFGDRPRVFRVHNFASEEETAQLISSALAATGENRLKPSTVGSGKDENGNDRARGDSGRTSENAWDHETPPAKAAITRSFQLTNIAEDPGKRDGLQIVRYYPGQGYNTHPDYFTLKEDHDFDFNPYSGGSNRFATVFMYLNDVEEGGFTVFPYAPGPVSDPPPGALEMFKPHRWEHRVTKQCYSQLAVPPKAGTAALFYSVTPDGQIDSSSHHAACPVTKGIKWGANIWLWNRQRFGDIRTGDNRNLIISSSADDDVYISWEGNDLGILKHEVSMNMNTFEFHRFKAHFGSHRGETISEYTVRSEPMDQTWEIKRPRLHSMHADEGDQTCEDAEKGCSV